MIRKLCWLLAATALAAGCSKSSNLTVNALSGASHASSDGGTSSASPVTVNRIRIVIRKVSLEDDSGAKVQVGPFLVDLPGAAPIHQVFDSSVPSGTYCELRFVINTLPAEKAGGDAGLIEMAQLHASIAVDGVVGADGGSAFTFTTPMEVDQSREGTFTVSSGSNNITLNIDPSGWFKAPDGSDLDPRDPSNRGRILANMRHSIRLFPDRDRHGEDEDECECRDDDDTGSADRDERHGADGGIIGNDNRCTSPDDDGQHKVRCTCKRTRGCAPPTDGGADGGTPPDGGTPEDGGTNPDGGTPTDGGGGTPV